MKPLVALITFLALAPALTANGTTTAKPAAKPPNILLIVLDDVGVDKVGVYAEHPNAPPTPNIDALAADGLLFRRFWAQPNCSPARAALLTGRYAFRTGVGTAIAYNAVGSGMSTNEVTIPKAIPHRNVALGKWHLQTQSQPLTHPLEAGFEIFAGTPAQVYTLPGSEGYFSFLKNINGTLALSNTYATTDTANDTITAISGGLIEPWFVVSNFQAAHEPFHVPPQELHGYGEPDDDVGKYDAMVEALDTEIGRVLDVTDLSDTVVILLGDNGTPKETTTLPFISSHAKKTPYEGGVRVPLIIAGPQVAQGECGAVAQIQDLFPTIIELAGQRPPPSDGVSMRPYLRNPARAPLRDWIYSERFQPNNLNFAFPPFAAVWTRAARDERYKVIQRHFPGVHEYYDLDADPFELNDLLDSGAVLTAEEQSRFDALVAVLDSLEAEAKAP